MRRRLAPGVATSLGPLPHTDPAAAVRFALDSQPALPAAPQLPAASEALLARAFEGVPGVDLSSDGTIHVDVVRMDPCASLDQVGVAGPAWRTVELFLRAVAGLDAPFTLQVPGPVTIAVALHAAGVETPVAAQLGRRVAVARAQKLVERVAELAPDSSFVVVVDEAGLAGSMHPVFPFSAAQVRHCVTEVIAALRPACLVGLHCSARADWPLVLSCEPDLLFVPVGARLETAATEVAAFLGSGGWIAWGAVPVHEPLGTAPDGLWRRLQSLWTELERQGCDRDQLRSQALVTPSGGLADFGATQVERALDLTYRLGERISAQAVGIHLSVGA